MMGDRNGFLGEMKRRHVWRVAIAYAVGSWLIVQIATQLFPFFHVPQWAARFVVILLVIGFPVAVIWAWVFELTPEGIRRTAPAGSVEARPEHEDRSVARKLNVIIVVVLVLAIAMLAWRLYAVKHASPAVAAAVPAAKANAAAHPVAASTVPIPAKSIAVLPFENLSSDKQNDYFVAGMQDLILTKLADVGDLKVISRTSTQQYGSRPQNLKTVGAQLGVATILEGSVQKQGNQVLINVQLINAQTDAHMWAKSYTRTLDNVFGVEGEVAGTIAKALNAKLSPAIHARMAAVPTTNKMALDAFWRAEYQANKGAINYDTAAMKAAIPLYRKAVELDPAFALAWARLSYQESQLAWFGGGGQSPKQLAKQARADAKRALQLKPDLAAAHRAMGYSDYWGRGDYSTALAAFTTALKLKPNDADTLAARGYVERRQGRFDVAITSLGNAIARDPRNSALAFELGVTYAQAGRYDDAQGAFERALALDPHNLNAMVAYANAILYSTGDVARALAAIHGDDPQLQLSRTFLLMLQRKYKQALTLLDNVPDTPDYFNASLSGPKAQQQADLYRLMGELGRTRRLYAQALPTLHAQLKMAVGINQAFVWQNVADVQLGLGQTSAGLDAVAKSLKVLGQNPDQTYGSELMENAAALYAQAKRPDLAVPLLAKAFAAPGIAKYYSPALLWLDPWWDPIRKDSGFQALLKKYAKYKPAVIYPAPSGTAAH